MQTARHRPPAGPWRAALTEVAAALLPVNCAGCAMPDQACCRRCRDRVLGRAAAIEDIAGAPRPDGLAGLQARAVSAYDDPVRSVIVAWKDHGRVDLTGLVAAGLARAAVDVARGCDPDGVVLVPVPSSAAAVRRRGADVLADAAAGAADRLRRRGLPVESMPVLRQVGRLADQAGLSIAERAGNVGGHFAVRAGRPGRAVAGRVVIIVDDVVTTGATAVEAVRVLRAGGAHVVGVASVAATVRRRPVRAP